MPSQIRNADSAPIDDTSILKRLTKDVVIGSTLDRENGDMGPRALAIAPTTYGLKKGQLLVCNFEDSSGVAGNGTTIEVLNPTRGSNPRRFAQSDDIKGCNAVAITSDNQVYAAGMNGTGLVLFNQDGKQVAALPIKAPFDDAYAPPGNLYAPEYVFVSDRAGSLISLSFGAYGTGKTLQVATGFADNAKTGWAALGTTGLQYDSKANALYIVDGVNDTVVEFTDANSLLERNEIVVEKGGKTFKCLHPQTTCGKLVYSGSPLKAPDAATILPNGNLIIANAGNNTLVELTPSGRVLDTKSVDSSKAPGIFGLAASGTSDRNTVLFFTDKNRNNVQELKP